MNLTHNFVFIIPSYNNADWYQYNIKSIAKQKYNNWRAIYVDDNSTDNTLNLVRKYVKELGLTSKFTYIQNPRQLGPAGSRYQAYIKTFDDEICCMLDGDDWLFGDNVLNILNNTYNKGYNCTYGSFKSYHGNNDMLFPLARYDALTIKNKTYRTNKRWLANHFRTMSSKLIKDIIPNKYLKLDNEWIKVSTDMAEMYFVLEKQNCKPKFIDQPIYIYNNINSMRYPNTYYPLSKDSEYRQKVRDFIKNAK